LPGQLSEIEGILRRGLWWTRVR